MSRKRSASRGPEMVPDMARRALLRRIGLAGTIAYTAPALTALGMARASGAGSGRSGPSISVPSGVSPRRQRQQPQRRSTLPEIVLALPGGQSLDAVEALGYRVLGARVNDTLALTLFRLGLPAGRSADQARAELAQLLPEATADVNHLYAPDEFICRDGTCDAHEMIGWSGWPSAFAPRIGMIDTGINVDHAALAGQNLTVIQSDLDERDAAGRQHGTAIAAMLLGRLDSRVPGLLPHAELVAVEAFHRGGTGDQADAFSLVNAIDQLLAENVSVINMSFSGPENAVLRDITQRAVARDVAMVAAAGNGGAGAAPAYPAAWPHVVAVTAVDHQGRVYRQANQGPYISFAAPGVGLWTAASISGGRLKSGTSFAAPFVTAALAVERMRAPEVPVEEVISQMLACAQDLGEAGYDPVFGHGLVSAPGYCEGAASDIFSVSGE
ncbi:MAG: S8 family serine peptidase [Rhodobacterales bacterium]